MQAWVAHEGVKRAHATDFLKLDERIGFGQVRPVPLRRLEINRGDGEDAMHEPSSKRSSLCHQRLAKPLRPIGRK
jgi:hypothetical protein